MSAILLRKTKDGWRSEAYLKYVRSLPCAINEIEGTDFDPIDPHHIKRGSALGDGSWAHPRKAIDLFTIPLLHSEHMRAHTGIATWERDNFICQPVLVLRTIQQALDDRAIEIKVNL